MENKIANQQTATVGNILLGEELFGKRILNVSRYILWGKVEYVIDLSGYLVISDNKLKSIFGSEKTFERFKLDQIERNPFKKIGGYALNMFDLSEYIFVERLNCFINNEYYFLLRNIENTDLKERIWVENIRNEYHFSIGHGFKRYTSKFFA